MANKNDVIKKYVSLAKEENIKVTQKEADKHIELAFVALAGVLEGMKDLEPVGKKAVRDRVTIAGFGSFEVRLIPERQYRDISKPGSFITKPAHNEVVFKPGTFVENSVNYSLT